MSAPSNSPPSIPPGAPPLPAGSELEQAFSGAGEGSDDFRDTLEERHEEESHKKRRRGTTKEHTIKELNLTAMMDMMTIILVFLLKNYATQPQNITLSPVLQPPVSTTRDKMINALPITITKEAILVDNKEIVKIQAGKVAGEPNNYTATTIQSVKDVLDEKVADAITIGQKGGTKFEGKVLIICDGDVPYALLMRVLYTAGQSDFTQYKLITKATTQAGGAP
jgi:biopolymer transport protein ExbD